MQSDFCVQVKLMYFYVLVTRSQIIETDQSDTRARRFQTDVLFIIRLYQKAVPVPWTLEVDVSLRLFVLLCISIQYNISYIRNEFLDE